MPDVVFEHLTTPTTADWDQIRAIYESNFPPVMQKPFDVFLDGVPDGSIILLVARADGAIIGITTLARLPATPTLYLGYLAVDPVRHNNGIGGRLFEFMVAFAVRHTDVDAIVWEVEAPEPGDPAHLHNRRIRFYERHGSAVITAAPTYRMPDTEGGTIPLRLMWLPLGARHHPPDQTEIASWIRDIYVLFYPGNEPLAEQIIAEMQG